LVGSGDEAKGFSSDYDVVVIPGKIMVGVGRPNLMFKAIDGNVNESGTAWGKANFDLVNNAVG
jgi:hypothetical protein